MLNKILIIIFISIIFSQLFIKSMRENLENVSHLDIIERLITNSNIKNLEEENFLVNFTRKKNLI